MIDKEIIREKFKELKRYLRELEKSKSITFEEFASSLSKQWAICHGLQLSIQVLIDVGNHILSALNETPNRGLCGHHRQIRRKGYNST